MDPGEPEGGIGGFAKRGQRGGGLPDNQYQPLLVADVSVNVYSLTLTDSGRYSEHDVIV